MYRKRRGGGGKYFLLHGIISPVRGSHAIPAQSNAFTIDVI